MQLYFVILSDTFVSRFDEFFSFVFFSLRPTRRHKYVFSPIVVIARNLLPKYLILFYRTEAVCTKLLLETNIKEMCKRGIQ
jgi:hypothetical protein